MSKSPIRSRPYPWDCPTCGKRAVVQATINHTTRATHEGVEHEIPVPNLSVSQCAECGEVLFDADSRAQMTKAVRQHLRLLDAEQIRANRQDLELTQEDLGSAIGSAAESLSRWERGVLQSRSIDTMLRIYFGVPEARVFLRNLKGNPSLGTQVIRVSMANATPGRSADLAANTGRGDSGGLSLLQGAVRFSASTEAAFLGHSKNGGRTAGGG